MKSINFLMLASMAVAAPVFAAEPAAPAADFSRDRIPAQLDAGQREGYAAVFGAIRAERWTDAQIALDAMKPGPLHAVARAELYTAKNSPKVELEPLIALLNEAPELPQAEALARLARTRGAEELPPLPVAQRLIWQDGAPRRVRAKAVKSDLIAADLAVSMQPFVKADQAAEARALLDATQGLSPEALTEWRAKIAWMYFLRGDDANARGLAVQAESGLGEWALQARWTGALSAWRQRDYRAAGTAFEAVAARATDVDLRAAGLYWAARADMAGARPDRVEARLKAAAQFSESFYGQLAGQTLGLKGKTKPVTGLVAADWAALDKRPNVRVAAALVELGEMDLADDVLRQQAKIGSPAEFQSLLRLAGTLDLPATSLWMAHNCPAGFKPAAEARYPTPNWKPDSGWRVDKALVYAHTLEESRFRNKVVSPAGAYGLMQIMPAAATDFARERGLAEADRAFLTRPSTNMDVGQRHLERLRDMKGTTGGLLPKVIAAYNAGPKPVGEWNMAVRDGGDPLLYIESIPYWETRGYVTTVLRNYWMYEGVGGKAASPSRKALAQGMWPRFPGLPGASAVRIRTPIAPPAPTTTIAASAPVPIRTTLVADAD
ncbi:MAG TPA: lytic transglycosylase domain-containing protein [Sphingomonas sp.]|jgi:soluble lytic murein transglycosylase-like protein|uniref:lytic transglycosylase domain-containing protein n=1 Tax=Sphingomonas sp. TaxID=28214 RepID=UPI002EDB2C0D